MDPEIQRYITDAAKSGIQLDPTDFVMSDEGWTIDGMEPAEWIHAMTMD